MSLQHRIFCGAEITKEIRHELFGKVAGGSGSQKPEDYQREFIVKETAHPCEKTNMRINLIDNVMCSIAQPNRNSDGFSFSENFDGLQKINKNKIYINLKCIVGKGGSQIRSLREVHWFIYGQLKTAKQMLLPNVYFANVLDGDEAHRCMDKLKHLMKDESHKEIKHRIFIGNLAEYIQWVKTLQVD
jgi:hypothetical protein